MSSAVVALVNDPGSHGGFSGYIKNSGVNSTFTVDNILVAVKGATYHCNSPLHGDNAITNPIATKTTCTGELVITYGAQASCGAVIQPPDRNVIVG
jgi:uncharacterized Zn-binding protein involved in type VI secretion